jgi:hypothetical protein
MQRGRIGALIREFANSKQNSAPRRAGAPPPGPDGSLGLPDPLGAGFLGAALAPFFVVVAWPVVSIRCVPPTPWVALEAAAHGRRRWMRSGAGALPS